MENELFLHPDFKTHRIFWKNWFQKTPLPKALVIQDEWITTSFFLNNHVEIFNFAKQVERLVFLAAAVLKNIFPTEEIFFNLENFNGIISFEKQENIKKTASAALQAFKPAYEFLPFPYQLASQNPDVTKFISVGFEISTNTAIGLKIPKTTSEPFVLFVQNQLIHLNIQEKIILMFQNLEESFDFQLDTEACFLYPNRWNENQAKIWAKQNPDFKPTIFLTQLGFSKQQIELLLNKNIYSQEQKDKIENFLKDLFPQVQWDFSFAKLGGDSISAIRLLNFVKSIGLQSDLSTLLQAEHLNAWLTELKPFSISKTELKNENKYPMSWMQEAIWSHAHFQNNQAYHEQFVFSLGKKYAISTVKQAYTNLWNAFPQLRVQIIFENQWMQQVKESEPDFRIVQHTDIQQLLEEDLNEAFEFPLMRVYLIEHEHEQKILWSHHHVLLDGWSVNLLINKFVELLNGLPIEEQVNDQQAFVQMEQNHDDHLEQSFWSGFEQEAFNFPELFTGKSGIEDQVFVLEGADYEFISSIALQQNVSLQSYVSWTFLRCLSHFSTEENFWIPGISSGRSSMELSQTDERIGLFIRNIPWIFNKNMSLAEFQKYIHLAVTHEKMKPEKFKSNFSGKPNVMMAFENYYYKIDQEQMGQMIWQRENPGFPFQVLVLPANQQLKFRFIWDSSKFYTETIQAFFNTWKRILKQESFELSQKIQWNNKINHVFEHWDQHLKENSVRIQDLKGHSIYSSDYVELTEKLIHILESKKIPLQACIALEGSRNIYLALWIFAIIRSGRIYIPLHPDWPIERKNEILIESQASLVISELDEAYVVEKISSQEILNQDSRSSLPTNISIDSTAYVLFTSGSTGKPKGIEISIKNLSALLQDMAEILSKSDFSHLIFSTHISFDLSIFESLFGLYVNKPIAFLENLSELSEIIQKFPKSLLNTVPSVAKTLTVEELTSLSVLQCAGEIFDEFLTQKVLQVPYLQVFNWYAPAESTTYSTWKRILKSSDARNVGQALNSEYIAIFSSHEEILEHFLPGEIWIAGEGIAKAYWKNEEKTKEQFVFKNGIRWYKTGDLAYQDQNNDLYVIGRQDFQLKWHGIRLEPSEIEQLLMKNDSQISQAICLVHQNHLLVFVESKSTNEQTCFDVLQNKLASHILPEKIIVLDEFPKNPNGKTDREQLKTYFQPITLQKNKLNVPEEFQKILTQLFGYEPDWTLSFIANGGDSILAMRLLGMLKQKNKNIQLSDIWNAKQLFQIFDASEQQVLTQDFSDQYSFTSIQQWFIQNQFSNPNHYNQSIFLKIPNQIPSEVLLEALQKWIKNHEIFQFGCDLKKWIPVQKHVEIKYFEDENVQKIEQINQEAQRSLDLENGPVAKIYLYAVQDELHLFICVHHFVIDGVSWRILLDDLFQIVQNQEGSGTKLKDLIHWNSVFNQHFNGQNRTEKEFWQKQLLEWKNPWQEKLCLNKDAQTVVFQWNEHQTKTWFEDLISMKINIQVGFILIISDLFPECTMISESHGREDLGFPGIFETCGWFTQLIPFPLQKNKSAQQIQKDWDLMPLKGLFFLQHYLNQDTRPVFPMIFNYLGNYDQSNEIQMSKLGQGSGSDDQNVMMALVELNCWVLQKQLHWQIRFHPNLEIQDSIDSLRSFSKKLSEFNTSEHDSMDDDEEQLLKLLEDL